MANSSNKGILFQFKRWYQIALSFDYLVFLNAKSDMAIMFSKPNNLTFKYLSVSPKYVELHLPHVYFYILLHTLNRKVSKQSLNGKTFESFLSLLKTWSLQEFCKPLRDFLNFILVCKEISPKTRFSSQLLLTEDVLWTTYQRMFENCYQKMKKGTCSFKNFF